LATRPAEAALPHGGLRRRPPLATHRIAGGSRGGLCSDRSRRRRERVV